MIDDQLKRLSMPFYSHLRQYITQRELESPALCLLVSHRPLAFVAGQFLYFLEPILGMFGLVDCRTWAQVLSEPEDVRLWDAYLETPVRDKTVSNLDDSERPF